MPKQEFRLGYSPKHSEILHWLDYRENTNCYDPRPLTNKLGFWAYPNNVGLGHKLPGNPTASWWSDQVVQYTHIYRCSSSPIQVKGNCGTLLWIRAAVNLSKCHLHFRSFRETSVNLNHSFDLFWVMDAFGNLMKATADSVQKLYPDSCLCVRIPQFYGAR